MDRLGRLRFMRSMHSTSVIGVRKLLVANRGEIAMRVTRAAADLCIGTVAIFTKSDATALHARSADHSVEVPSYFDAQAIVTAAVAAGCDALHPGYGFLSESAAFARQCESAGLAFVGPTPETIEHLGDKLAARALARSLGVPLPAGSSMPCTSADEVRRYMAAEGVEWPLMLKAAGGGGGRGIRPVLADSELDEAFAACMREADATGLGGGVFFEQLVPQARHLEVQLLGDGTGEVSHLFERDCSVQRRRQKILEVAPAVGLDPTVREEMLSTAVAMARAVGYRSAGTVEFLLGSQPNARPLFLECNPRIQVKDNPRGSTLQCQHAADTRVSPNRARSLSILAPDQEPLSSSQVEHTVSEEATGVDLVRAQLLIAGGHSLAALGLQQDLIQLRASAIQARVQMTRHGRVTAYATPGGLGMRVESCLYAGYTPAIEYDPLLLKLISRAPLDDPTADSFETARRRLLIACGELHIGGGVETNVAELRSLLDSEAFARGEWTTALLDDAGAFGAKRTSDKPSLAPRAALLDEAFQRAAAPTLHGQPGSDNEASDVATPAGCAWVRAPMQGLVIPGSLAELGAIVGAGSRLLILEALKMEFDVPASTAGAPSTIEP